MDYMPMIRTFRHKGLQQYFEKSERAKLNPKHVPRIQRLLDRLDASVKAEDMNVPGFGFHDLKGDRKGTYAVEVSGNWRITFRFDSGDALDVDLEDYH